MMMRRARVVLADDHTLLLEAFKIFLEPEFEVVGTFLDGSQAAGAMSSSFWFTGCHCCAPAGERTSSYS